MSLYFAEASSTESSLCFYGGLFCVWTNCWCLEIMREIYQNCSVLCCVRQ